jgi:hypothetical protein
MNCLENMPKSLKSIVLAAAAESGQNVEWRDEPDARMDGYLHRDQYGSVWSDAADLSQFWRAFRPMKSAAF